MQVVDVGVEFYQRLTNRDHSQGDGRHTAVQFRNHYLRALDNQAAWDGELNPFIALDFKNVVVISPSFANELFAHFIQYAAPDAIFKRIKMVNITDVKKEIIEIELRAGMER